MFSVVTDKRASSDAEIMEFSYFLLHIVFDLHEQLSKVVAAIKAPRHPVVTLVLRVNLGISTRPPPPQS